MTNKEIVLAKYPDAKVCEGDDRGSRIIMRPGQCLSAEFPENLNSDNENYAELAAWEDAAFKIADD